MQGQASVCWMTHFTVAMLVSEHSNASALQNMRAEYRLSLMRHYDLHMY